MVTILIILLIIVAITQLYIRFRPNIAVVQDKNLGLTRLLLWYDSKSETGITRKYIVLYEWR